LKPAEPPPIQTSALPGTARRESMHDMASVWREWALRA
jgi:hypothetical protein